MSIPARMIARPFLPAVQNNVIALCNYVLELDVFTGVAAGGFLKIGYESVLAVSDPRIVLNVAVPDVSLDGLARLALIEHEVIKGDHVLLIAFQIGRCHSHAFRH
jgi:hypothetical protein